MPFKKPLPAFALFLPAQVGASLLTAGEYRRAAGRLPGNLTGFTESSEFAREHSLQAEQIPYEKYLGVLLAYGFPTKELSDFLPKFAHCQLIPKRSPFNTVLSLNVLGLFPGIYF